MKKSFLRSFVNTQTALLAYFVKRSMHVKYVGFLKWPTLFSYAHTTFYESENKIVRHLIKHLGQIFFSLSVGRTISLVTRIFPRL